MFKTAEYVSPMHPDKMCDRISDAILDLCLYHDKMSRVAVETMGGHGKVYICGEITCTHKVTKKEIKKIVKDISGIKNVEINIVRQSPEIAQGVDVGGAGDQGIMVGYACNENIELIPQEIYLARSICQYIYAENPNDGKTQITLNDKNEIDTIVVSWCGLDELEIDKLVCEWMDDTEINQKGDIKKLYNPAGNWDIGGFDADTGLTGRKIAVDNYGPRVPIGGGAFSGKDCTKVDRSGAYKARQIAVTELKENKAKEVIVKIAYAIGYEYPLMVTAEIDGKEKDITNKYDCRPLSIIKDLELRECCYNVLSERGHFSNNSIWDIPLPHPTKQ
ncbi:MAG: methionine adenosyltransferase [Bacteroidia bacterium]|nr:methionine adenosyltransferase [Bacteroidia bacterium]